MVPTDGHAQRGSNARGNAPFPLSARHQDCTRHARFPYGGQLIPVCSENAPVLATLQAPDSPVRPDTGAPLDRVWLKSQRRAALRMITRYSKIATSHPGLFWTCRLPGT